jgi:hypothetical protein
MTEKNKKYVVKEKVRNTVELWVTEVDEDGKVLRNIAEFLDYASAHEYVKLMNKKDDD